MLERSVSHGAGGVLVRRISIRTKRVLRAWTEMFS